MNQYVKKAITSPYTLCFVAGLAVAFLICSAMPKAQPKTITQEKIVYQDRIVEKVVYKENDSKKQDQDIQKDTHTKKETETVVKPDGTKVVKEVVTTDSDLHKEEHKEEVKTVEVEKVVERVVYQDREVTKKVENLKDWSVQVRLGTSSDGFGILPVAPYVTPVIMGASVERRIIGSFKAGLWAQTNGFKNLEGGICATIDF